MNNKGNKKVIKKNKYLFIVALAVILLIGTSFAWLQITLNGTKQTTIKAGTLSLVLDDSGDGNVISIDNAVPLSDSDGEASSAYNFSVRNTGNIPSVYNVYLDDADIDSGHTRMADNVVKYNLTSIAEDGSSVNHTNLVSTLVTDETSGRILVNTITIQPNKTNNYELRLWIDESAGNEIMDNVFSKKLRIEATQVKE